MITANLATWSARRNDVNKAIDSLIKQVDKVRVYYNDYTPEDMFGIKNLSNGTGNICQ